LADADFDRPPSSNTIRSSSLTVPFPNSTKLASEWLQARKKLMRGKSLYGPMDH